VLINPRRLLRRRHDRGGDVRAERVAPGLAPAVRLWPLDALLMTEDARAEWCLCILIDHGHLAITLITYQLSYVLVFYFVALFEAKERGAAAAASFG
jgi:hypothetical protein